MILAAIATGVTLSLRTTLLESPPVITPPDKIEALAAYAHPSFLGAEGHGTDATGGGGPQGEVLHVRSPAASGPGSLQEALNKQFTRTIIIHSMNGETVKGRKRH